MRYRTLGRTDVEVSVVAMGCWPIVGDSTWGPQDEADSIETIKHAVDCGINFFDTAEMYGDGYSEELLGRALADCRDEVVIGSKAIPDHLEPRKLREACEGSLRRLNTDYIDLYQLHWPNADVPIEDSLGTLEELKEEGKIRVTGVSNFGQRDLGELLRKGRVEVNQLPYNMLFRAIEFGLQGTCAEQDISILPYCPLAQALLTGKFSDPDEVPVGRARTRHFSPDRPRSRHDEPGYEEQAFEAVRRVKGICGEIGEPMADVALAWLLEQPAITSVLAGARTPEQVQMNAEAGDLELPEEIVERLNKATEDLKQAMGPNVDMWETESRIH